MTLAKSLENIGKGGGNALANLITSPIDLADNARAFLQRHLGGSAGKKMGAKNLNYPHPHFNIDKGYDLEGAAGNIGATLASFLAGGEVLKAASLMKKVGSISPKLLMRTVEKSPAIVKKFFKSVGGGAATGAVTSPTGQRGQGAVEGAVLGPVADSGTAAFKNVSKIFIRKAITAAKKNVKTINENQIEHVLSAGGNPTTILNRAANKLQQAHNTSKKNVNALYDEVNKTVNSDDMKYNPTNFKKVLTDTKKSLENSPPLNLSDETVNNLNNTIDRVNKRVPKDLKGYDQMRKYLNSGFKNRTYSPSEDASAVEAHNTVIKNLKNALDSDIPGAEEKFNLAGNKEAVNAINKIKTANSAYKKHVSRFYELPNPKKGSSAILNSNLRRGLSNNESTPELLKNYLPTTATNSDAFIKKLSDALGSSKEATKVSRVLAFKGDKGAISNDGVVFHFDPNKAKRIFKEMGEKQKNSLFTPGEQEVLKGGISREIPIKNKHINGVAAGMGASSIAHHGLAGMAGAALAHAFGIPYSGGIIAALGGKAALASMVGHTLKKSVEKGDIEGLVKKLHAKPSKNLRSVLKIGGVNMLNQNPDLAALMPGVNNPSSPSYNDIDISKEREMDRREIAQYKKTHPNYKAPNLNPPDPGTPTYKMYDANGNSLPVPKNKRGQELYDEDGKRIPKEDLDNDWAAREV